MCSPGGKQITITGSDLGGSKFADDAVKVGGVAAVIDSWSATEIKATLPAMSQGQYPLTVKVSNKGYANG